MHLDHLCHELQKRHAEAKSWRIAGAGYGISGAMARLLVMGYKPGRAIRKRLNLTDEARVVVVYGEIPDGTQAIRADRCACGQWYISNHPRRRKCFQCSPYRRASAP